MIDTNVLIYHSDKNSKFYHTITSIIKTSDDQFVISSKVITEYFAVCSKLDLSIDQTLRQFNLYKSLCSFLFVTKESFSIFESLVKKYEPKGNQVFDLEIVSVMLANDINTIFTLNKKDFAEIEEVSILEI